ncbi:helix-turn-helix domain-containing protein [Pseudomonas aeruginosa]|nr:transcriptional regulator [Pseudomonas aeruginosa]OWK96669.1 transcriptional regulator [Pseudomonas aeruginosa 148]KAA2293420.1 helix-turn-helix domain-containing protein [Pseudomonas aeruginosa]KAB0710178.1 helix-turn-helix domain-containing protein [Pseudomonas aeruginosa]KGB87362.1 transcriptional regulator [Pseudomonas aeruginosa]
MYFQFLPNMYLMFILAGGRMRELKQAVEKAGGVSQVAASCEVSPRAVYKWLASGRLPRTDYTGETDYAERICGLARGKGFDLSPAELRASPRTGVQAA